MTHKKLIFAFTCIFVVLPITAECPRELEYMVDIPCTCVEYNVCAVIKCNKIDSDDLNSLTRYLSGSIVWNFKIEDSELDYLPYRGFKGVKLSMLVFENSSLPMDDESFDGLEDHLEALHLSRCVFENGWEWSYLKNLHKLKELSISSSLHLETAGKHDMRVSVPSNVETINFQDNDISVVSDRAFDLFKKIKFLFLSNNKIKNLKRTMFPNPTLLRHLDLRNNSIEQFPEDMFKNMPNLRNLDISLNKIVVLDEKAFSPVWEQLRLLVTHGNPLHCDCHMSWLLKKRTPYRFNGECASPPELETKTLKKLNSEDLVCIAFYMS